MATLLDLATKALHDDFGATKYGTAARDAIRTAIGMIYSTTRLAQSDYQPAATVVNAGALSFPLPDSGLDISSITHVDTGQELDEVSLDEIAVAQQRPGVARGRPRYYAITDAGLTAEGITIALFPIPDKTYTLQVIGRFAPAPADLDADADVVPIPARYEDLLIHYARSEMFALEGDAQQSDFHLSRFNGRLSQLRGDLNVRSNRTRRVAGTWSDGATAARFRHPQGLF